MSHLSPRHRLALVTTLVLAACATVPITGRKQVLLLSEGEETSLGLQSYQEVISPARSRISSF